MPVNTQTDTEKALVEFKQGLNYPEAFVIKTSEDFVDAGETLKDIKARQKKLDEMKKGATRPIDEAKRAILALFADPEQRLRAVELRLKGAISVYNARLERLRAEEEARQRDLQRKEQERLLARASKAATQGNADRAAELEERAENLPVPIVVAERETVKGISTRIVWQAEVVDFEELVRAVATGEVSSGCLKPDMAAINGIARALKGTAKIPGVRVFASESVVARSD